MDGSYFRNSTGQSAIVSSEWSVTNGISILHILHMKAQRKQLLRDTKNV